MIDRTKNLCYVITVRYFTETFNYGPMHTKPAVTKLKEKSHTFISLHSSSTQKCQEFAKAKAHQDPSFAYFSEEWLTQQTIPNEDYCK